jgi:hypothetical protein
MSKILSRAAIIILGLSSMGTAQARPVHLHHNLVRPGYAGQVYTAAPAARFVTGRGTVGMACDMPSSTCSNDERING